MPVIREVSTREASIDELRDYLIAGGDLTPHGMRLGKFEPPQFQPGQFVYVPKATGTPSEIGGRGVLIVDASPDADDIVRYKVRYADDAGFVLEIGDLQEDVFGATIRTSPTDYVARAVVGNAGMTEREISPLSWLKSLIDVCELEAVREAALSAEDDPDPDAYFMMVREVASMHSLLRALTGMDFLQGEL